MDALPACVANGNDRVARARSCSPAPCWRRRAIVLHETGMHHALCQVIGGPHRPLARPAERGDAAAVLDFNAGHADAPPCTSSPPTCGGAAAPCRDLARAVRALNTRLGLPTTLRDAGAPHDLLPTIAALAFARPALHRNPRPVPDQPAAAGLPADGWMGDTA